MMIGTNRTTSRIRVNPAGILFPVFLIAFFMEVTCAPESQKETAREPQEDTANFRDPHLWPFEKTSFWNMPIGSDATYTPQPIHPDHIDGIMVDLDIIILTPNEALRDVYATSYLWQSGTNQETRCQAATDKVYLRLPVPDGYVTNFYGTRPNNPGAILQADGRTLVQTQPFQVCPDGLITTGLRKTGTGIIRSEDADLYGEGRTGGHGGSGLSSLGGAIRIGELSPGSGPIRHALKISFPGEHYLYYDHELDRGFRWPAVKDDSNAAENYNGTEPEAKIGCLRAIPPWIHIDSLGLETEPGRKIAWTLQNYGAYQVEGVPWARMMIAAEDGPDGCVPVEFKKDYGYDFVTKDETGNPWYRDLARLMPHIHIVDNNGPSSIGGGGDPRQPLAPGFYPLRKLNVTTDGTPGAVVSATEKWITAPDRTPRIFVETVPPGYRFSHWSLAEGAAVITDSAAISTTVLPDSSGATVQANFEVEYYTLQTAVEGMGYVEIDPQQDSYLYGTEVTLTAVPNAGWAFQSWGGDVTGTENPLTFPMPGNTSVVASFLRPYYSVVVGIGGNGSVTREPDADSLLSGTEVTLTAEPDPGWTFINWTGSLTSEENPLVKILRDDLILYATFDSLGTSYHSVFPPGTEGTGRMRVEQDPLNRSLLVQFGTEYPAGAAIRIFGIGGREVLAVRPSGQRKVTLSTAGLPPGIYLLKVYGGSKSKESLKFLLH